jgi:hypothetical protein
MDQRKAPWTIKAVPVETRRLALDCANRAGLTMAEWMDRAVHTQARTDAGNAVLERESFERGAAPPAPGVLDASALLVMMQAAAAAAHASGQPMSKRVAQRFYGLVDDQVRSAGGLPARKSRRSPQLTIIDQQAAE